MHLQPASNCDSEEGGKENGISMAHVSFKHGGGLKIVRFKIPLKNYSFIFILFGIFKDRNSEL